MDDAAENVENLEQLLNNAARELEETGEEVAQSTTTETVAATEAQPTETTQETTPEKTDEEDDSVIPHGEKSRLGRKVKRLEDTLSTIKETLDFLKDRAVTPPATQPIEEELELPEGATSDEIKEYINKREERILAKVEKKTTEKTQQESEKIVKYGKAYRDLLGKMIDPDDPDEAEILRLMTATGPDGKQATEYNQVYSDFSDAKEDFLINFRAATRAVINKIKPGVTKTTVHGKPSQIPTGVNIPGGSKPPLKVVDTSNWSQEERELAAHFSAEELASMNVGG